MGYLHIENLYKNQTILLFKECYALEKIHGTSAHISWNCEAKILRFFSGGEKYERFISIFDRESLEKQFSERFLTSNVVIYGEAYGGKQQGMSETYGKELKFVCFDVKINDLWLDVPKAEEICKSLGLEFVYYTKISTDVDVINVARDAPSAQAIRNSGDSNIIRAMEGVVLRPLTEFTMNNGERVISKHKRDEFRETVTVREISPDGIKILEDANHIADEWVTEMRLSHVLDKLPRDTSIQHMKQVIEAVTEDVYREAKGEIVESKAVRSAIGRKTATLFKQFLQKSLK